MRTDQGWAGTISCFLLFIAVCFFLLVNIEVSDQTGGRIEPGLLLFIVPGVVSGIVSGKQRLLLPVLGAILAVPVCLILINSFLPKPHSVWQMLAWLSSAVFWCSSGVLCLQFVRGRLRTKRGRR